MTRARNRFLQFNTVPYPLWRRRLPALLAPLAQAVFSRTLAADADRNPPASAQAVARYMGRWGLLNGRDERDTAAALLTKPATVETVIPERTPVVAPAAPVRLPAQWEPMETILLAWPVVYPALWEQHAQMTEAIAPVAPVTICVPTSQWAQAVAVYLQTRGRMALERARFLHLPTDDIWVRDFGPLVGLDASGEQVCVKATYDPLPNFPQTRDNAMARHWAAHEELPVKPLDLHIEGGNIWSDGAGTILTAEHVYEANPGLTADMLRDKLHEAFGTRKLIVTPSLWREETGHVDLLVKMADAQTLLVSAPTVAFNGGRLRAAADVLRRETNAAGQPYRVLELPTPPLYVNWLVWPVWRSYTNALTVNGRVLVPVFGVETDAEALRVYAEAMPQHEIIPIDCAAGANGGGAVHCLTKEIPARGR